MANKVITKDQPTQNQVHVDAILTNLSVAYIQDTDQFIADKVFPQVPVSKQSDSYYVYDKQAWFKDDAQLRPPSTESAGGGYSLSTETYNALVYAFHKDLDDRVMANYDNPLQPRRDSAELVAHKLMLKREYTFMDKFLKSDVWGTDIDLDSSDDQWSDYANSDPITYITQKRRDIYNETGFKPNRLLIGGEVWDSLKDHPEILDRVKYTREAIDINPSLVARAFDLDDIVIAEGLYSKAAEGETDLNLTPFVDKKALLYYAPRRPSLLTPSAGYIFTWNGYTDNAYAFNTSSFYMESIKSERIEGEMAYDQKVIGKDLGLFMENVVE